MTNAEKASAVVAGSHTVNEDDVKAAAAEAVNGKKGKFSELYASIKKEWAKFASKIRNAIACGKRIDWVKVGTIFAEVVFATFAVLLTAAYAQLAIHLFGAGYILAGAIYVLYTIMVAACNALIMAWIHVFCNDLRAEFAK